MSIAGATALLVTGLAMLALRCSAALGAPGWDTATLGVLLIDGIALVAVGGTLSVLAYCTYRRRNRARITLSLLGVLASTLMIGTTLAGLAGVGDDRGASVLWAAYVGCAVALLWTRPAKQWFDPAETLPSGAPPGGESPDRHPPGAAPPPSPTPPGDGGERPIVLIYHDYRRERAAVSTELGHPVAGLDRVPGVQFTAIDPGGASLLRGRKRRMMSHWWDAVDPAGQMQLSVKERMYWPGRATALLPDGRRYHISKHYLRDDIRVRDAGGSLTLYGTRRFDTARRRTTDYQLAQLKPDLTLTELIALVELWWLIRTHQTRRAYAAAALNGS